MYDLFVRPDNSAFKMMIREKYGIRKIRDDRFYRIDIIGTRKFVIYDVIANKYAQFTVISYEPFELRIEPCYDSKIVYDIVDFNSPTDLSYLCSVNCSDYIYITYYNKGYHLAVLDYKLSLVGTYDLGNYVFNITILHKGEIGYSCYDGHYYSLIINHSKFKVSKIDNSVCGERIVKIPENTIPELHGEFYLTYDKDDIFLAHDVNNNDYIFHVYCKLEDGEKILYAYYKHIFYIVTNKNVYRVRHEFIGNSNIYSFTATKVYKADESVNVLDVVYLTNYKPSKGRFIIYKEYRLLNPPVLDVRFAYSGIETTLSISNTGTTISMSDTKGDIEKFRSDIFTPEGKELVFKFFDCSIPVGVIIDGSWYIYSDVFDALFNITFESLDKQHQWISDNALMFKDKLLVHFNTVTEQYLKLFI